MSWDVAALRALVTRQAIHLKATGRADVDISRDAEAIDAFMDWLEDGGTAAGTPARPSVAPEDMRPLALEESRSPSGSQLPPAVQRLLGWLATGSEPRQAPIPWPRGRWIEAFPELREFLEALPTTLDRATVKAIAGTAAASDRAALEGFVAVMAWGFGNVGYGPFRTRRIIDSTPEAPSLLRRVAVELRDRGPIEAYERFRTTSRLAYLGPAFGTKFLYFAQPEGDGPRALILDALVSAWLARELAIQLPPVAWDTTTYRRYLDLVEDWARDAGCAPEAIEYSIFQAMSNERGSQWANGAATTVPKAATGLPEWVSFLPSASVAPPGIAAWDGKTWAVATYDARFRAMYPRRTAEERQATWRFDYGKPLLLPEDGDGPTVGEFEVIKALRAAGWEASWTDTFGSAPEWMREWKQPEPIDRVRRIVSAAQRAVPRAKPWDVWAWRGEAEVRFIEFKGPSEKLTDAELRFLAGATKAGVPLSSFAIVRGTIDYPDRQEAES